MIKRQNPSSVWHMVNSVSNECCLFIPTPRVLILVVHKNSQGPRKLAQVLCFVKPTLISGRSQFRVPSQAGRRQEAGSSPAGLTRGSSFCSLSGLSVNTSAVRLGSRLRASEVHQANPFFHTEGDSRSSLTRLSGGSCFLAFIFVFGHAMKHAGP